MMGQSAQEIAKDVASRLGMGYGGVIEQLVTEYPEVRPWEHARAQLQGRYRPTMSPSGWLRRVLSNATADYGQELRPLNDGGIPAPLGHPTWQSYLQARYHDLVRVLPAGDPRIDLARVVAYGR